MNSSQYITERTNNALSLVNDAPDSTTVLDTNHYFALMFCTEYQSYLRNYIQYKGFSNYNEDLDLYDIDLNKNGFDTGYYVSKDYYNLKKVFKQVREDRGRIIVVSVNDNSKVELIDEGRIPLTDPVATAATNITTSSFSANWNIVSGALGYYLDVSTSSDFSSFVIGYENRNVGNVLTYSVIGLHDVTNYYYQIRAYNNSETSNDSNVITLITLNATELFIGTSPSGLILKSIDYGLTFTSLGSIGKGVPMCWCQLFNGDLLYGTDTGYVVNHTKGTYAYTEASPINYIIQQINDNAVEIAVNGKLYRSNDNGVTISIQNTGYSSIRALTLNNLGSNVVLYTSTGIYDYSNHLKQSGNFESVCNMGSGILYAGASTGHVWKSIDYGENWIDLGLKSAFEGAAIRILYNDYYSTNRIFYMTNNGYVKYTEDDFTTVVQSDYNYSAPHAFIALGDGVLIDVWTNEIQRCTNNGIVTPPNTQWLWEPNSGYSEIDLTTAFPGETMFGYGIIKITL